MVTGLRLILAMAALAGETAVAAPLEYYLWPATEFKRTLDGTAACELVFERNLEPTASDSTRLRKLAWCANEAIRRSVARGVANISPSRKSTDQMARLGRWLIDAQEKFGFDKLHALGLIKAREDLATLIAYASFIPTRAEVTILEEALRARLAQGLAVTDAEGVRWDLSILQQLTGLHNLAFPNAPIPAANCDVLLHRFFSAPD